MRLLILFLLVGMVGCGSITNNAPIPEKQSIVGAWKFIQRTNKPLEIEKIIVPEENNKYIIFKSDNTYEAEFFNLGGTGEPAVGTYKLEDSILTLSSPEAEKATIKFQKDFLIITFLEVKEFWYLKRID